MNLNRQEQIPVFSFEFLGIFVISWLINLLIFLIVPYLTYLKPEVPKKLFSVDLFRIEQYIKPKEEKIVKKEKPPEPVLQEDTENINPEAKEQPLQETQMVYELSELDSVPQILYREKPKYPEKLRRRGIEGKVVLRFVVNYFGYVEQIVVLDDGEQPLLVESAVEAIRKWRFTPPKAKGRPVSVWFILPIRFELD